MSDLILSVVTPERAIVSQQKVEAIVLPGERGQLTLLPGHINFITPLSHGTFAYKISGEWKIAFLAGGFTQVFNGNVSVLAETMEMENELNLAAAELELQEITNKMKAAKVGGDEYLSLTTQKEMVLAKIRAANKKIH